jgi:NTE family protein
MVRERFPWDRLEQNFDARLIQALAVSATDVATGRTFVFVQARDGAIPTWATDWRRVGVPARIGPEHALASAALPLLFPPVTIDGRYFCDGGLRQITPLSPALRLGAERALVVSLRWVPKPEEQDAYQERELQAFPGALFLVSKVLNSLLLDQLDHDLHTLEVINSILETGTQVYGEEFQHHLDAAVTRVRGAPYRRARSLVLRPSLDLGLLAAKRAEKARLRAPWRQVLSLGLRLAAPADQHAEGDILSYLFFDGDYLEELAELGYRDAAARRSELVEFFGDADEATADDRLPRLDSEPLVN